MASNRAAVDKAEPTRSFAASTAYMWVSLMGRTATVTVPFLASGVDG